MKTLTKIQARQALIEGKKIRNIRYSDNEYLFLNKNGDLETEDGYTHGGFLSEFWNDIQSKLPDEWYVIEEKSTRKLALEWWNKLSSTKRFDLVQTFNKDKNFERISTEMTGREIEKIWSKENTVVGYCNDSYPLNSSGDIVDKPNQKQFKEFNPELFKAYIDKFSDEDKIKAFNILKTEMGWCTLGVGNGRTNHFVHGDYDSIKILQSKLID
jgi:hypothetical protein